MITIVTTNEVLIKIRRNIDDMQKIKFSDEELIDLLNNAIDVLSDKLITEHDPEMIKTATINGQTEVLKPLNAIKFAGNYPVQIIPRADSFYFKHLDPDFSSSLSVRYYASKPSITSIADMSPFTKHTHIAELVNMVVDTLSPTQNKAVKT